MSPKPCPFCGGRNIEIGDEEAICECGCILVTSKNSPGVDGVLETWDNRPYEEKLIAVVEASKWFLAVDEFKCSYQAKYLGRNAFSEMVIAYDKAMDDLEAALAAVEEVEKMKNWIAYEADNSDYEMFETFEEAKKWLLDDPNAADEGYGKSSCEGESFIAKITHRTKYTVTDSKGNYHVHTDDCPEDCPEEEWPYNEDFDGAGILELEKVEEKGICPICGNYDYGGIFS